MATTPHGPTALSSNGGAIRQFSDLPDAAYVRIDVVAALFDISKATVWRWVNAGRLPKPRKFGEQVSRWPVGELRRALASHPEAA